MKIDKSKLPRHVAIVMDGNRRWAALKGKSVFEGHRFVVENRLEELIDRAGELGISYITFWAWSSENWKRGEKEVKGIMKLFRWAIRKYVGRIIKKGARIRVIGDIGGFDEDIERSLREMVEESKDNKKITVTLALNYGGRDEILRAIKKLQVKGYKLLDFGQDGFAKFLDTGGMPDPDLIIRPGGTKRLSGFLLWQCEYSELYFTDVLMPDFDVVEFEKALVEYSKRERRFGGGKFEEYSTI